MPEELSVSLGQLKQVLGISFALGTALVWGEVRLRELETHKETSEPMIKNVVKVSIDQDKKLALLEVKVDYIESREKTAGLTSTRLEW